MSDPASASSETASDERSRDCAWEKPEEPTAIAWQMDLGTVFEVNLAAGVRMYNIGGHGMRIAPTGERAVFSNDVLRFTGTTATWLALSIRVPAGNIRILWDGSDLVVDGRYLLAKDFFAIRYRPVERRHPPPVIFIDCFGPRESRLHMHHHDNVYALRFESDYPVMVVPRSEYLMLQVSLLRDQRAAIQRHHHGRPASREHAHTPRSPPIERLPAEADSESDMDFSGSSDSLE